MSRVAIMVERPSSPQQRVTVEVAQHDHDYWLVVPSETTSALELIALSARNEADLIIQLPTGIVHLVGFFDVPETGFKLVVKSSNNDLEVLSLDSQETYWQLHQRISAEDSFQSSTVSFNLPDPVWEFIAQTSLPGQQDGDEPTLLWWHYASCGVALASGVYLAKQTVADDDLVLSGGVIESSIAERHDLMVSVVDVDGATLGGQFEIAPDGSFDAILPRQSGVVIFVASSASESSTSSSDFLSASVESPLDGSLYAMRDSRIGRQ